MLRSRSFLLFDVRFDFLDSSRSSDLHRIGFVEFDFGADDFAVFLVIAAVEIAEQFQQRIREAVIAQPFEVAVLLFQVRDGFFKRFLVFRKILLGVEKLARQRP